MNRHALCLSTLGVLVIAGTTARAGGFLPDLVTGLRDAQTQQMDQQQFIQHVNAGDGQAALNDIRHLQQDQRLLRNDRRRLGYDLRGLNNYYPQTQPHYFPQQQPGYVSQPQPYYQPQQPYYYPQPQPVQYVQQPQVFWNGYQWVQAP